MVEIKLLALTCVAQSVKNFTQVQIIRFDVKSHIVHDLLQFILEGFVHAFILEETFENWV